MATLVTHYSKNQTNTSMIGLLIGISSWAMMFMTMIWGYVVYRMRATEWLAESLTAPIQYLAIFNTMVLISSSICYRTAKWRWAAFGLGLLFLIGQVILWQMTWGAGIDYKGSMAGSIFYLLTGFHALHIVGGLIAMLLVCLNCFRDHPLFVRGVLYFWDLLLAVWIVLFGLIFIVK